jgi:ankyrin repeat protein
MSALTGAASVGNLPAVRLLLAAGADVNYRSEEGSALQQVRDDAGSHLEKADRAQNAMNIRTLLKCHGAV